MAKYMIHSCNDRQWYVAEYLVPSMLAQGIKASDITIYQDHQNEGCLMSCMQSFRDMSEDDGGTWHLQDDVVIANHFKYCTERYNYGIVCGICTKYDKNTQCGESSVNDKWFSFPCIRIPNKTARHCGKWFFDSAIINPEYRMLVRANKYDDSMFWQYVEAYEKHWKVTKLKPNIVNHIDYLLGGSVTNKQRGTDEIIQSIYWQDDDIIEQLKKKLSNRV